MCAEALTPKSQPAYNSLVSFDPVVSLRIINNERLRRAQGWGEYRDLGGVLAVTSDAPLDDLNCLETFTTDEQRVDALLDIGFALLRAFDRDPAVHLTPLDRPAGIDERLRRRRLAAAARSASMVHRDGAPAAPHADVDVRVAGPEDARAFADVHSAGSERWMKRMALSSALAGILEPGNRFYIAYIDGQPAGTTHLLMDGGTAGIYAVATLKAYRNRGVATTLLARAVADAREGGCDVIALRTAAEGDAMRLYESLGFALAHESVLWTVPR
jgi:ribosomal protein S18 acetylase RimI-like enzyme